MKDIGWRAFSRRSEHGPAIDHQAGFFWKVLVLHE
jgi:hypothetical protein